MSVAPHHLRVTGASSVFHHADGHPVTALNNVSVEIPAGEFVCVVGRSGSGKSTFVRSLAGLNRLSAGRIEFGAAVVAGPSAARGMVFQEDTVFPWLRVRSNVEFGLASLPMSPPERRRIADEWLRAVGLDRYAGSWPRELSGGMRKRVALATVFAAGGDLLLMDEPFGSLDYVTRLSLHAVLLQLWRRTARTIVFVTHDIEEALLLADRILVFADGRLVDDMPVPLERPRTEDIRATAAAVTITKTIIGHLGLRADGEQFAVAAGDAG